MKPILAFCAHLYSRTYILCTKVNRVARSWQWDDLRFFLAAVREGSLSGAARSLDVNHVRVGRRITFLEKQLGARLLKRTSDGLIPTAAGEAILTKCETMHTTAEEVERLVAGRDESVAGLVRVAAPQSLARRVIVPAIGQLQTGHAELQVNLTAGVRPVDLSRGEADMAVRINLERPTQRDLISRKLGAIGYALYASQQYSLRHNLPRRGDGLRGHELVSFEVSRWPKAMGPLFMGESLEGTTFALRSNDQFVRLDAAIGGLGIAEIPCFLGDCAPELVRIWPGEPPVLRPVWLVTHRDMRRAARILLVSNAIVDGFDRESKTLRYGLRPTHQVSETIPQ